MKITEKMRLKMALEMIEESSSYAQSMNPKKAWRDTYNALCHIYEVIHSIRAPKCRKNHPAWYKQIDVAIKVARFK